MMSTVAKLAGFALGLAAVFGAALGVGNAVGPVGPSAPPAVESPDGGHPDLEHEPEHEPTHGEVNP